MAGRILPVAVDWGYAEFYEFYLQNERGAFDRDTFLDANMRGLPEANAANKL